MPDPGKQPPHLAVLAFRDHDFQQCAVAVRLDPPHLANAELPFREEDSVLQLLEQLLGRMAGDQHAVDALDLEPRMSQTVGQFAVIGDQQQTFGVLVQPSHRKQPGFHRRQQIDYARPACGIGVGAETAFRLVQQEVFLRVNLQPLTVDRNFLRVGIDAHAQAVRDLAIDRDSPRRDVFLTMSARAKSCSSQHFLQSLSLGPGFGGDNGFLTTV